MDAVSPTFEVRLAADDHEVRASQRLRYRVFVEELGGDGPMVDHDARLERDAFDPHYDHMILIDHRRDPDALDHIVGVYRLMPGERASQKSGFYCADEYDLDVLTQSGRRLLELGRSCLHPAYRGGPAMYHLWQGLAAYALEHRTEILFGVASFHGTDPVPLAQPLSMLHHRHLAPPDLRVRAAQRAFQRMDLVPEGDLDRVATMRAMPALIKAYLRLGGFVGEGAFVDRPFNTTDICLVVDVDRMNARQRAIYTKGLPG